jgi:hypothetical protein
MFPDWRRDSVEFQKTRTSAKAEQQSCKNVADLPQGTEFLFCFSFAV